MMLEDKKLAREVGTVVGRQREEIVKGVEQLKENNALLQKELKKAKTDAFTGGAKQIGTEIEIDGIHLITHHFGETDRDIMSGWIDKQKESNQALIALGLGNVNGKTTYMAAASAFVSKNFNIDIGKMSKELLSQFGGSGGGKATFAQGTVSKGTDAEKFFDKAKEIIVAFKGGK